MGRGGYWAAEEGVEGSTALGIEIGRKFLRGDWDHREETAGCTGPSTV